MATIYNKQDIAEIKKERDDLLKIILKKTNTSYNELVQMAKDMYIAANIDVVSPTEKMRFTKLSFE